MENDAPAKVCVLSDDGGGEVLASHFIVTIGCINQWFGFAIKGNKQKIRLVTTQHNTLATPMMLVAEWTREKKIDRGWLWATHRMHCTMQSIHTHNMLYL